MYPIMANKTLEWEKRLEIEEEQRKNRRLPRTDFSAGDQSRREERRSIFEWIFRSGTRHRTACAGCVQQRETQPG